MCLPEQLLKAAVGILPSRASSSIVPCRRGAWVPHSRSASLRPTFASHACTVSTCRFSPLCEAQASAMCSLPRPKRSTAPLSTKAMAWIGLLAERGRIGESMSPHDATTAPSGFTTAAMPSCRLSTTGPRVTSMTTALAHRARSSLITVMLS